MKDLQARIIEGPYGQEAYLDRGGLGHWELRTTDSICVGDQAQILKDVDFFETNGRLPDTAQRRCDTDLEENIWSSDAGTITVRRYPRTHDFWLGIHTENAPDRLPRMGIALTILQRRALLQELVDSLSEDVRSLLQQQRTTRRALIKVANHLAGPTVQHEKARAVALEALDKLD